MPAQYRKKDFIMKNIKTTMDIIDAARIACDEYNAQVSRNVAHKIAALFTRKHTVNHVAPHPAM